jgi:hypothetical protein
MDNATRKELLYKARAAGYPGSILDVYANYDQGKDLIGEFQDQQRHQQMSGMAAQQSGLQQSAQQGGQQPQIDMQPEPVAMPAIPSLPTPAPNFTPPQPPAPIGVQSQNSPMGMVSGQSGPNQGRAIFATGGFTEGDPVKEFDLSKSMAENLELNRRARAAGWNSVADYEKAKWGYNTAAQGTPKVDLPKFPTRVGPTKEAAVLDANQKEQMKKFAEEHPYRGSYPNDPAGLPSVPIFETALMAGASIPALVSSGEALGGSAFGQAAKAAWNYSTKSIPGLSLGNLVEGYGAGVATSQIPENLKKWQKGDYKNAAMEAALLGTDFMGIGVLNSFRPKYTALKTLPIKYADPELTGTKLGQSPDLNLQLLKEKGPQFEQRVLELSKLPPYNSVMDEGFDPNTVVHRLNTEIVNGKPLPSLDVQLDAAEQHKLKYCPPGAACAESSNHIAQSIWNKLNPSEPYAYNENAADAWYTRDQMVRHGGEVVYDSGKQPFNKFDIGNLQIGDQVMMGPGSVTKFPDKDPVTGLLKEDGVQHRATIVGRNEQGQPLILESGLGNTLIPVPLQNNLFYSNSGNYGIRSIVRPKQFIGAEEKIAERLFKNGQINTPGSIEFDSKFPSFKKFYNANKNQIKHTLNLNPDEADQVFRAVMGIGAQETKLNNRLPGSKLAKAKVSLEKKLEEKNLTPIVKSGVNAVKKLGNALTYFPNKDLAPFPGNARLEMEAHKLVGSGDFKNVKEAIGHLYATKYNKSPKFSTNSTIPSKGMFKQKEISNTGKSFGLDQSNFANNEAVQLESAMANLADITKRLQKDNPDYSFEKALDLAILSWNSPSKAKSKDLVDFYYHGIGNPNPDQIKFDYLEKIKANMAKITPITNVKPKSKETIGTFVHKTGGVKEKKCYTCVGRKRRV